MNKKPYAETAQGLASMGRYGDSMLVHMTPGEVAGLQALAMQHGTSMTINPKTGLPEAFILAPLVGLGLKAAGFSALKAGIATGLLGWAVTGDLGQGLLAGLGGYGGAGLGESLGKFGAGMQGLAPVTTEVAKVGAGAVPGALSTGANLGFKVAPELAANALTPASLSAYSAPLTTTPLIGSAASLSGGLKAPISLLDDVVATPATAAYSTTPAVTAGAPNIGAGISKAVSDPMSFINAYPDEALTAAGMVATPLLTSALQPPGFAPPVPEEETLYEGPYFPTERAPQFPATQDVLADTGEYQYFRDVNPYPGFEPRTAYMAEGGSVFENPDPGSDPMQDADDAMQYGIGGLSSAPIGFAPGGEIDYGLSGGPGRDAFDIPSVAFQSSLSAYDKKFKELTAPKRPSFGAFGMYNQLQPGMGLPYGSNWMRGGQQDSQFGKGLTKAQAIAQLGKRPVWNPNSVAPAIKQNLPASITRPVGGAGITQLPTRAPQMSASPALEGFKNMASGIAGTGGFGMAKGGFLDGPGDGMSDSIPATIAGKQPARLADGEFVVPADVVSHLGNGSTKAGAKRLYAMMDKVRHARTGSKKQGKQIKADKYIPT